MDGMESTPARQSDDRSQTLTGLFGDLYRETTALLHGETELMRAELSDTASRLTSSINVTVAGWLTIFAGLLALLAAAVIGLAYLLEWWLSALIVGGAVTLIGIVVLAIGNRRLKTRHLAPHESAASLRRDRNLIRERM